MNEQARQDRTFWTLWGLALFVSAGLFFLGFGWFESLHDFRSVHHDWQEFANMGVMFVFLPLVILGAFRPTLASLPLFVCSFVTLVEVLGLSRRTGDGTATGTVMMLVWIGVPTLLSAFLFRRRVRQLAARME